MSTPQTAPAAPSALAGVVGACNALAPAGLLGGGAAGASAHTFGIGDRVERTGAFAGICGTVTAHDRTVYGDPLLWVLMDGYAHSHLYQPDILVRLRPTQLDIFGELVGA